jgi:hypothetical protein
MVKAVMDQLITYGQVKRGIVGIKLRDLTPEEAESFMFSIRAPRFSTLVLAIGESCFRHYRLTSCTLSLKRTLNLGRK